MCEQTEINYLDGDIVWVKLGACWWPGQVTSFENLPDDIQIEFKKKPLIAAVKFFQEDTYEFVKNLHQIYKYNCTQKDDFIKKGLDKYRTKSKDGTTYMDKFPGDVEMAEKLTGGDPDILTSDKFSREEKPDISALFGEKKIPKRKRERDEMNRRSEIGGVGVGGGATRKITHPRFLRESDHEIRIRQQPSSLPSTPKTPNTDSPQFSCNLCSFTSTRVNVIICHRKSHCSVGGTLDSSLGRPRITSYSQPKITGRPSMPVAETQKKKYVRKTKSLSSKSKVERESEPVKRKLGKQMDKSGAKKKKTDPELREKLLADWDDETDDDMDIDLAKSADTLSIGSPSVDNNTVVAPPINSREIIEEKNTEDDNAAEMIIEESEKLLRETEKFTSLQIIDTPNIGSLQSNNKHHEATEAKTDTSTSIAAKEEKLPAYKRPKKLIASREERKSTSSDKDDKQSRFSCFDFDEEDLPEPTIAPVRKIPRIFGEKNTSVKKEILKKFTMSQALKNVKDKEKVERESDEKIPNKPDFFENKVPTAKEKKKNVVDDAKETGEEQRRQHVTAKEQRDIDDTAKVDEVINKNDETRDNITKESHVTEVEIVEIFEVEGEKDERDETDEMMKTSVNYEIETFTIGVCEKKDEKQDKIVEIDDTTLPKDTLIEKKQDNRRSKSRQHDETISELATTENEDKTLHELAETIRSQAEKRDNDETINQPTSDVPTSVSVEIPRDEISVTEKPPPRRRGRPRKSLPPVVDTSGNGNDSPKNEIISKKVATIVERDNERKTSESDTERSYGGRRGKLNKRYFHTKIDTSSPDNRGAKTDESQSETEDKVTKVEHKSGKTRREKKKSSIVDVTEKKADAMDKTKDQEVEFYNRTSVSTVPAPSLETTDFGKIDKEICQLNVSNEVKSESIVIEGETSVVDFGKKFDTDIETSVDVTKITKISVGDTKKRSAKKHRDQLAKNEKSNQSKDNKHQRITETVTMIPEDAEMSSDVAKNSAKFDTVKMTSVDKLPPKKSQIKKFELSQIDLLDACAEQVAAEQAAADKIIAEEELAAEKLAAEKLAAERIVAEKLAAEKLASEKLAAEKLAAEKLEAERLAAEKLAAEKLAAEKLEAERLAAEKLEAERLAAERLAAEKLAAEKLEAERIAAEELAAEKLEAERIAAEELAAEKLAAEKLAAEKLDAEKLAAEKLEAEKLEAEKLAAEKLLEEEKAAERIAAEKLAAERIVAEKLAAEKLASEQLEAEKLAAERLAAEELAAEKLAAEKLAAEKLASEKLAMEEAAAAAAEKLAVERAIAEKAEAERIAVEEEKIAAEKRAEEEKIVAEKRLEEEKIAAEKKLEEEKIAAEQKLEEEKIAAEKRLEEEKIAAERKLEEEKIEAERKLEVERIAAEKMLEEERIAAENKVAEERIKDRTSENEIKLRDVDGNAAVDDLSLQAEKVLVQSVAIPTEKELSTSLISDNVVAATPANDSTLETIEAVLARITNDEVIDDDTITPRAKIPDETRDESKIDAPATREKVQNLVDTEASQRSISQTSRYKCKLTTEKISKAKKDISDEEIPINSFQEAFLKTLQIDKKDEKDNSATTDLTAQKSKQLVPFIESQQSTLVIAITPANAETIVTPKNIQDTPIVQPLNAMTEFEGVEILVQENITEVRTKIDDSTSNQIDLAAALVDSDIKNDGCNTLSLDLQKIQETLSDAISSTPSPSSDIGIPVKKREKPRIIENVTLKEPMQILKNKLLEKSTPKTTKHKLDTESQKKGETKCGPRAKIMKMEGNTGNSGKAARSPTTKTTAGTHFTITRKLQVLKAEEAATAAAIEKDKAAAAAAQAQLSQTISIPTSGEKFIQQSSQSLADMEFDINSMPFVLSEDVLTPESIENMPVVISSIIPSASTSVPTSLCLTTVAQLSTSNSEITYKSITTMASDNIVTTESTVSTGKKKSGTPAILKNKGKGKPTITSIKTLVPPFASGVKGLKFQSQQQTATGKAMPVVSPKNSTPGKYVIVQTAGGQQMRYSVQGKPGSQQKIAIPAGKATGSAQIVQQGGKVVILTSAQSGQTKMLPLNISKTMGGKVQKIVNNKGQIYTPMSTQSLMGQKTIIAPKTEVGSPTTSKLSQGQKILNTQGIITSKGVLTPISTSKSGLLGLSQGILTKGGIYTPISSAQLTGKTIISGKNLVTKGTTILSPIGSQTIGTSKGTVLTPITHTITGKTMINAQGLVTPKGTVLTPITGQQVKAIAAKSPGKAGAKVHYQSVQQKLQLPMLQKCQKIPVSSSPTIRAAGGSVKSPSGTIVFQNTIGGTQKMTSPGGKKIIRQIAHQGIRSPQAATTAATTTTNVATSPQQVLQRAKSLGGASTLQRSATPRGRQSKQKIVVQKMHDTPGVSTIGTIMNMQSKPIMSTSVVGNIAKSGITGTPKQTSRAGKSGRNSQKHLLNVASTSSVGTSPLISNETLLTTPAPVATTATTSLTPTPQSSSSLLSSSSLSQSLQNLPVSQQLLTAGTELSSAASEGTIETQTTTIDGQEAVKRETSKSTETTVEPPKLETTKITAQPQIMALPTESSDGTQTYVLVTIDEQGQIQPLDNNTLMSLEGTTQNADGTRTLYIDPSSLGDAGTLDNIVLQFDNNTLPNLQTSGIVDTSRSSIVTTENFPSSEIIQTSNQDILAAALANTDFQQEIGLPDNTTSNVMTTGMTQTSLINQTILQSTIIPPTEPISSPSVLETSLTLNQPIMTPLEVPSNLPIQIEHPPPSVVSTVQTSLELPITITNPTISYISSDNSTNETHIQIPGNSMPDIGEIMDGSTCGSEAQTDIPVSTQYLVLPNLDDSVTIHSQTNESTENSGSTALTYSVSIPETIAMDNTTQSQTTPSMPIIDDGYVEATEQSFADVTINEMLVSKSTSISTDSVTMDTKINETIASPKITESSSESPEKKPRVTDTSVTTFTRVDSYKPEDTGTTEQMIVEEQSIDPIVTEKEVTLEKLTETSVEMQIEEQSDEIITTCQSAMEESCPSEMKANELETSNNVTIDTTQTSVTQATDNMNEEIVKEQEVNSPIGTNVTSQQRDIDSFVQQAEQINTSCLDSSSHDNVVEVAGASMDSSNRDSMIVEQAAAAATEMEIYPSETPETTNTGETSTVDDGSSQAETIQRATSENIEIHTDAIIETSQEEESPSQSYEQFNAVVGGDGSTVTSDSTEIPTQSVGKSENSREPSQSIGYDESMEIDENTANVEPPTQSYEDTKRNEASQSYERTMELNTNAPTQSFNEIMQCQEVNEQPSTAGCGDDDEANDDQSFPTQSYVVGKIDAVSENLESDATAVGHEGNIPSQSNDIGNDGVIGTSSICPNNSGLNEDETASSSYVPETPETQERDQDQESAISTSSYEIPPCEELNIASSSVIPDTSVRDEHMSIHDNGVPEIPTSSYNLNPDSSSTSHVDALPTSSYEERGVVIEQNVSTSYEVPISMPGIEEETSSQNFVTESTDHNRNEPTSYYARHPEVTASYYETVNQDSNSRLESADDPQEEVTPSYYEQPREITSEASQSYFRSTGRYTSQNVSPSYYDPITETEASQSSNYYSHDIETGEQSSSASTTRNVEASQSFYQETTDERRLRQQGEATPTYTERYPIDYALENSPIERHDLVESSVPATRPTER